MNIIIVGCGKVGLTLAHQLTEEEHDITVIDTNAEKLQGAAALDVQLIVGNGTSFRTQEEADIENADLFIAVTDQDEINLLSCLIARKSGRCKTIARVRTPQYQQEIEYIQQCMGISLIINPELAAAAEIDRLIHTPSALEVDTFAKGRVELLKLSLPQNSALHGISVPKLSGQFGGEILVCIVERGREILIPNGETVLKSGDHLYVIIPPKRIGQFCELAGIPVHPIHDVMIVGGSKIGYYLSKRLLKGGIGVKIVERDEQRCEELSESLSTASIIHGDASDHEVLLEEGLSQMDAFVSLTGIDESNVFLALFAAKHAPNCKKITKNDRIDLSDIADSMNLGSLVSPKDITAEYISQYVRSQQDNFSSAVEAVYRLAEGRVEALEFRIKEASNITGIPLMKLNIRKGVLLCGIIRDRQIITPGGQDTMEPGDTVIVVTTHKNLTDIRKIVD